MPCLRFLFPVSLKICHFFPAVYVPFPPSTPFSFGAKLEKDNFQCSHSILSHHWMWISLFMLLPWPYRVSSIFQQQIVFFLDFYDEETNKFVCDCSCPTWFMQLSTRFWRVSCSRTVAIVCQKNEEHKIKAKTIKSYAWVFLRILKRGQKKIRYCVNLYEVFLIGNRFVQGNVNITQTWNLSNQWTVAKEKWWWIPFLQFRCIINFNKTVVSQPVEYYKFG